MDFQSERKKWDDKEYEEQVQKELEEEEEEEEEIIKKKPSKWTLICLSNAICCAVFLLVSHFFSHLFFGFRGAHSTSTSSTPRTRG